MKKLFDLQNSNWLIHFIAIGALLLGAFVKFFSHSEIVFDDPFHHGEFVATLPSVLLGEMKFFTIHGALDWLPAWCAQLFVGTERHFLITMALYAALNLIACFLLYLIIALFAEAHRKYGAFILLVSSVTAIYLVSYRDLFLLLSIFLFFLHQRPSQQDLQTRLLEVFLGIALAVGMFWSFDRGAAGIGAIGGACLILFATEQRHSITVISFILFISILSWIGFFSFTDYIDNFNFLLSTSSQWSYGFKKLALLMALVVVIFNTIAGYYLVKSFFRSYRDDWREVANHYLIFVLCLIMLKIGINRADLTHVVMAVWMPILAYLYNFDKNFPHLFTKFSGSQGAILIFTFVLISINGFFFTLNLIHGRYHWIAKISAPPRNGLLVDESIQWVSAEILKAGSNCVFDLSNNGVINGVTGLPACTKYTYPVYATQGYEADMIQQLQKRSPPVVVYSSTHWAFEIDGKSMYDRFPELKNYLVQKCT